MLESSTGYFQEPLIGNKASVCNGPSGLSLALVVGLLGPGCFLPLKYLCIISPPGLYIPVPLEKRAVIAILV